MDNNISPPRMTQDELFYQRQKEILAQQKARTMDDLEKEHTECLGQVLTIGYQCGAIPDPEQWFPEEPPGNRIVRVAQALAIQAEARAVTRKAHELATPQPAPVGLGTPVYPKTLELFFQGLRQRRNFGIEKYGTELRAFNGRDALIDCFQELIDAFQYLTQEYIQREVEKEFLMKCASFFLDLRRFWSGNIPIGDSAHIKGTLTNRFDELEALLKRLIPDAQCPDER